MAIYFGNLDRELADRQNVLKEDAARQYRGYRDVQQNFGSLGTTVSSSIRDVAQAKLDGAKLEYNISRNQEADEIRAEQHSQSTTRNRELSLQSELKNIEGFNKVKIREHIGKQWYWRDPKAVRTSYDDRMKVFTADKINLDETDRIKNYPNLFGKEAIILLGEYNELLKAKANNVPGFTDADLKAAKDKLPLTPMNFMDWAKDTGQFNDKITGSPSRIGGAMYTSALQRYGYNIPDVTKLYKQATEASASPAGVVVKKEPDSVIKNEAELMGKRISDKEIKGRITKKEEDKGIGVYVDESGIKHPIDPFMEGNLDDVVSSPSVEDTAASEMLPTIPKRETTYNESGDIISLSDLDEKILADQKAAAEFSGLSKVGSEYNQDNSPGYPGRKEQEAVQLAVDNANSFSIIKNVITKRDEVKRGPNDPAFNLEGPEAGKDLAFIPAMEAGKGRDIGAKYSKLPNYSTRIIPSKHIPGTPLATLPQDAPWENVSPEEKAAILRHPAIEFGSSPKSVAGLIKAEDELEQIDKQILFINGQVSKGSKPDVYDPQIKWKQGQEKTTHFEDDFYNYMRPSLSSDISPEGGALSLAAQGAISNVKDQQVKDIAKQLPRLENRRKQLAERVKYAESDVYASQSDKSKSTYRGSLASDLGVRNISGPFIPSTIRPEPRVDATSGMALAPGSTATEQLYVDPKAVETDQDTGMIDAGEQQEIYNTAVKTIIDKEGHGTEGEGHMYFDGEKPTTSGDFNAEGSQNLVLAGGNNIYDTINSITNKKKREKELKEVATGLFGEGKRSGTSLAARLGFGMTNKDEFLHYMNMPKKDHKAYYNTHEQRGAVKLSRLQRNYLTDYSMNNHLERLIEKHPYLNNIARYPKEMQLFIMDNAFNMGPGWLGKFTKMEGHLKKWVKDGYKKSDLKLVMKEYKNSDHFRKKISKARALENYERLESMLG